MCNFQSALIPQPLLPSGEKGSKSGSKSLSALGEGLKPSAYMKRVRGFRKVAHRVTITSFFKAVTGRYEQKRALLNLGMIFCLRGFE